MKRIGIFTLLNILAACRADLDDSSPIPNSPLQTPDDELAIPDQPTPTTTEPTSSLFLIQSVGETSTSNDQTSPLVEQTSPSAGQTSTSNGQTSSAGPTAAPVLCGPVPRNIHRCIGGPALVKPEWGHVCSAKYTDECELMTCVYEKAGWINNGVIDKVKITNDFSEVGKNHRKWMEAVKEALEICVWHNLLPQGVYLKCPAYDVTSCIESAFVRKTPPSQWSNSTDCERTKQIATSCPFCPEDCFAPVVPYGSCQACLGLARSA